ncbi:uncharacterized protein LOC117307131 isoform X1 [Asterias rubens]|uniref:uncharacterized protein LOC117307131 isoform X1 n=2 Tax=Asterias rubens TaxID=7604 RepID=UPI001455AF96|nr:uncharacterized protein LOC117307131 isoform X1 [Asterias rubens]
MANRYDPNGGDPCSVFFNGFANDVKPSVVSAYFHEKGHPNRILYQRIQPQQFRLYLALKFENPESAKEVCEKFNKKIIFGYKILLSFFKKTFLRRNYSSYPFMQDRLRKMRAQAARRPFCFKKRFNSHLSPARNFRSRSRRRSRSSSSNSDRSISPKRKRRTRSREKVSSKRRDRSHSRSRSSRSSRSSSRSRTPNRFSLSPSSSKRSNSSVDRFSDKTSYSNKRKVQSKVSIVDSKKYSKKRSRSMSETENSPTKGKLVSPSPHKERFLSNFSPVSCTSDDDAMLAASTSPKPALCLRTMTAKHATVSIHPELKVQMDVSNHTANLFSPKSSSHSKREDWDASEGDSTPLEGTPSPRGPGLGPLSQLSPKPSYSVYGKVGTFKEIKTMDRPWQLKPLTIRDEGSTSQVPTQVEMQSFTISVANTNAPFDGSNNTQAGNRIVVQNNRTETPYSVPASCGAVGNGQQQTLTSPTRPQSHPSSHDGGWSPSTSQRIQSPTASSTIKVNGLKKPGQPDFNQDRLERLKTKKEEIIKAYKQDCDTFATVVRMLIRKDAGLEQRLQQALRENLTEIGQRCVQELQDVVDQMKD